MPTAVTGNEAPGADGMMDSVPRGSGEMVTARLSCPVVWCGSDTCGS